jgi:LacI family transcriptional regulator
MAWRRQDGRGLKGERMRRRLGFGKATVEDIARAAGVSTATVSRVLNGSPLVRPELKARVGAQIEALGYVRHGAARTLASNRSHTIGAVVPTINNAIFAAGIEAFERRLEQAGYTLLLAVSNYSLDNELRQVRRLLEGGVDALMLIGNDHRDETFAMLERARVPHVATWSYDGAARCPNIGFDNRDAAMRIVDHLAGLGHRSIGMIAGMTDGNDRAAERLAGVRAALARRALPLPDRLVFERPYSIEAGREALSLFLKLEAPPTAIICGNDVLALGVLFEAIARGISVPDDLSVTGFDNLPLTAHVSPPLTTIDVPSTAMGEQAAGALLAMLQDTGEEIAGVLLEAPLLVRSTTGPAPNISF